MGVGGLNVRVSGREIIGHRYALERSPTISSRLVRLRKTMLVLVV